MDKQTNKNANITLTIKKCHSILKECVSFDNIEDKEFIYNKLNIIKGYQNALPNEVNSKLDKFIKETIYPIIYDADYFSFLKRAEYGSYNENGHFEINSEHSLEMMIFLLYEHTLKLGNKIDEFAFEYLHPSYVN